MVHLRYEGDVVGVDRESLVDHLHRVHGAYRIPRVQLNPPLLVHPALHLGEEEPEAVRVLEEGYVGIVVEPHAPSGSNHRPIPAEHVEHLGVGGDDHLPRRRLAHGAEQAPGVVVADEE